MKTTLYTNLWETRADRWAELSECFRRNAENPVFDRIVCLSQISVERQREFNYAHVSWVDIPKDKRPTYRRYFDAVNKWTTSPEDLNVIANSDVYFDGSLALLKPLDMENVCAAMSRWEHVAGGVPELKVWHNSQDVWAFKGRVRPMGWCGFGMGVWGCDNRLAWELLRTGYRLVNPCRDVRCYHLHDCGVRDNQTHVGGPVADVKQTDLAGARLGPAQPIRAGCIAFSLYGNGAKYTRGAVENVRLARWMYPGWTCRIYHDESVPREVLGELFELRGEMVLMPTTRGTSGMFWRLLAATEPGYARTIIRDADSRYTYRERRAVDEWIASGLAFHRMRDHPWHEMTVLGGAWGMVNGTVPDLRQRIDDWPNKSNYGDDESFLASIVWPLVKGRALTHAAIGPYDARTLPFPIGIEDWRFVCERINPDSFGAMEDREMRMRQ